MQLAVDQINEAGGVNGSDVTLLKKDSGTAEDVARTSANEAIADGVAAVLGAAGSGVALSLTDLLSQNEIVQITGSATSPQLTSFADNGFLFRTAISDDLQGQVLAKLLSDEGCDERRDHGSQRLVRAGPGRFVHSQLLAAPSPAARTTTRPAPASMPRSATWPVRVPPTSSASASRARER